MKADEIKDGNVAREFAERLEETFAEVEETVELGWIYFKNTILKVTDTLV